MMWPESPRKVSSSSRAEKSMKMSFDDPFNTFFISLGEMQKLVAQLSANIL
jgi:hypothetical protein